MSCWFQALNTLGSTKWRVNKRVLSIIDRIWSSGGRLADLVDRADVSSHLIGHEIMLWLDLIALDIFRSMLTCFIYSGSLTWEAWHRRWNFAKEVEVEHEVSQEGKQWKAFSEMWRWAQTCCKRLRGLAIVIHWGATIYSNAHILVTGCSKNEGWRGILLPTQPWF